MKKRKIKSIRRIFDLQQDKQDCGVACLFNLIKYYGGASSVENLRKLSGTNILGTTMLGLFQAANQMNFTAEGCQTDMGTLFNYPDPTILHVINENNLQHYVICFGITTIRKDLLFIIGDPAIGIIFLKKTELEKIWLSKSCITLVPNEKFILTNKIKRQKQLWIKENLKEDYHLLITAIAIGGIIAALGLSMTFFSQRLIDEILPKKQFFKLNLGIALLILLLLAKEIFSLLRQYLLIQQSKDFNIRIINSFYGRLLQMPKLFFDTRKIGDLTARLNDATRIQKVLTQIVANVIIDILAIVITFSFLFFYSYKTGIFCLTILPFYYLLIKNKIQKISGGQLNAMIGHAASESNYISTLQGISVIKECNKQKLFANRNRTFYQKYQDKIFLLGKTQNKLSFFINCFGILFLIGILFFNANQVLTGNLKVGQLIAILGMCGLLLPSIGNLALISIPINEAKVAFNRMFEFVSAEAENESEDDFVFYFKSLSIKGVAFRFAGRNKLLHNINLEVKKGEFVGIMGENGCGKTTLAEIILKNYLPENGGLFVNDNINLSNISFQLWRKNVASIPQIPFIFNSTILENIAFEDATENTDRVISFLKEFEFLSFFEKLPHSYMTLIGEEGINISGGQRQMIALARVLYKNPKLIVLDEATSSMDRLSEQFVLKLLQKIKKDTAIIFITHRLDILKSSSDNIYIIDQGKTLLSGTHEQLLRSQNLYSNYYNDFI